MFEIIKKLDMRYPNGDTSKRKVRYLECLCNYCNEIFECRADCVKGRRSCGCMGNLGEVKIGEKFDRLIVTEDLGRYDKNNTGNIQRYVRCECDCRNIIDVIYNSLKQGDTKSCGCKKIEQSAINMKNNRQDSIKHGMSNTKIYYIWSGVKFRCYNETDKMFDRYGGRGIKMCEDWKNNFSSFYEWSISNGYEEGLSIDRVDNDGDYEPNNCQWLTISENSKKMHEDKKKRDDV